MEKLLEYQMTWGRYKGLPIQCLLEDRNYTNWLKDQSWLFFKDRTAYEILHHHQEIHPKARIIPNQMTPHHNKVQAEFLDPMFQVKALTAISPHKDWKQTRIQCEMEANHGWDVVLSAHRHKKKNFFEIKTTVSDEYPNILRKMKEQIRQTKQEHQRGKFILWIENFSSLITTRQTLQQIFHQEGIEVVFADELRSNQRL